VETTSFREGDMLYVTGRGDDVAGGSRGGGSKFTLSRDTVGDSIHDAQFIDDLVLKGGMAHWANASLGDSLSLMVWAPASVATPNGGGTGNCNLVPIGGGLNAIIPADGDGAYDVVLTDAVPVPNAGGNGGWNRDDDGNPAANPDQSGGYDLFDFAPVLVRHAVDVPLLGSGTYDVSDSFVKPKTLLRQWKIRVTLHKETDDSNVLALAWWLQTGRAVTTNAGDAVT
jgi:hypothetical protein